MEVGKGARLRAMGFISEAGQSRVQRFSKAVGWFRKWLGPYMVGAAS